MDAILWHTRDGSWYTAGGVVQLLYWLGKKLLLVIHHNGSGCQRLAWAREGDTCYETTS